jgi:PAS domain S-box-containing protein
MLGAHIDITEHKQMELALRRSEIRFINAQRMLHFGNWELDVTSDTGYWSPEMFRIHGLDESLGPPTRKQYLQNMVYPDDVHLMLDVHQRALQSREAISHEHRIIRPDGQIRYLHSIAQDTSEAGGPVQITGTVLDITECKQREVERERLLAEVDTARAEAVAAHELLTQIIERVKDGFVALDKDWRYTYVNQQGAQFLNRKKPTDLIGKHIWTEYPEGVGQPFYHAYQTAMNTQEMIHLEDYYEPWDRWFENRIYPSTDGLTIYFTEITERKRAERVLHETEERLRLAVKAANVGLWDWNLRTNEVYYSPEWKRQIGYEEDEIKDDFSEWESRVHPDDLDQATATVQAFLAKPYPNFRNEFRFRHKDGSYRWILAGASLAFDANGKPIRMLGSHIDITERKRTEEALAESEAQYRLLVENSPNAISMHQDGKLVFANATAARLLGAAHPEELLGKPIAGFVHPENRDAAFNRIQRMLRGETGLYPVEDRYVRLDGSEVVVNVIAAPFIHQGRSAVQVIVTDITERKRAEQALRASEERFSLIFHNSPVATVLTRVADTRFVDVNEAMVVLTGYARDELLGRTSLELNLYGNPQVRPHLEQRTREAGSYKNVEIQLRGKSGQIRDVVLSADLIELGGEKHVITMAYDITERKQAEKELKSTLEREHQQRLRAQVLRHTAETLVGMSEPGESIRRAAEHLQQILEFNTLLIHQVEGNSLHVIANIGIKDPDFAIVSTRAYPEIPVLHHALTNGTQLTLADLRADQDLARKLGVDLAVADWMGVPLIWRDIVVGLLSIGRDRTLFSAEELEIIQSFGYQIALALDHQRVISDLENSLTQLQAAQKRLVQTARLSAIGELAAGVAHQINNPLMTVIADSHLLLKQLQVDTPAYESAEAISRAAYKAGGIVQRMLDFARTRPSEMKRLDINQSLQQTIDLVRTQIEPHYAEIRTDLAPDLPPVSASEEHMQDIWTNLLLNATDAVRDRKQGLISIRTYFSQQKKGVIISIEDNGVGIEPENLDHIFEPFFTTKERGTGLGLAICADMVKHHGGSITVESQPGSGTKFSVTLPAIL